MIYEVSSSVAVGMESVFAADGKFGGSLIRGSHTLFLVLVLHATFGPAERQMTSQPWGRHPRIETCERVVIVTPPMNVYQSSPASVGHAHQARKNASASNKQRKLCGLLWSCSRSQQRESSSLVADQPFSRK